MDNNETWLWQVNDGESDDMDVLEWYNEGIKENNDEELSEVFVLVLEIWK